jgi:transposase
MAPHLSKDLCDHVVKWWMESGMTYRELANLAECSIGTICTILSYYKTYGQSTNPLAERTGWPRLLDQDDRVFIDQLLEREPLLYLDEISSRLEEAWNSSVSLATLQRALVQLDLTRKTVSKQVNEHNEYLRAVWEGEMAEYDNPDVFLFLDESAVNNLTMQRYVGWSPRGVPCVCHATFLRGVHYSVLPALTMDGIVALDIFEGSVTQDQFLTFLHEQIVSINHSGMV